MRNHRDVAWTTLVCTAHSARLLDSIAVSSAQTCHRLQATKFVVSLNKLVSGVGVVSRTASAVGAGAVSETGSCTYGSYICCLLNDGTGLGVWAISNPLYTARCRHRFA